MAQRPENKKGPDRRAIGAVKIALTPEPCPRVASQWLRASRSGGRDGLCVVVELKGLAL